MDYIKIPRSLIYKDRTDLKDFGVQAIETVNQQLFLNLKKLFMATDRAKELILRCFNNAYYICTLIPFEDFPDTQVAEYEKLLLKDDSYDCEEICAVSMAMVCKLLPACDAKWRSENVDLIKSIYYRFTHYQWMSSGARKSFEFIMEKRNTDFLLLPPDEFAPRSIIDAIENISTNDLAIGVIYICEKLALLEDQRKRIYGADLAIARLNDDLRKIYDEWGYDPKTKRFDSEKENPLGDIQDMHFFSQVTKLKEKAIEYIIEHFPVAEKIDSKEQTADSISTPETEDLQAQINILESKINHQNEQLTEANNLTAQQATRISELAKQVEELQQKLAELLEPVEELTAEQKVRMAFALELLKEAGLTNKMLDKHGNKAKAATIMYLLTGITSNNERGNKAQICQTFLSDKARYFPRKENMDTLIKLNNLCVELGIRVNLSLQSQGNK